MDPIFLQIGNFTIAWDRVMTAPVHNQGLDAPGIDLWTDTHIISVPLIIVSILMLLRIRNRPNTWSAAPSLLSLTKPSSLEHP